jgi:hypothetical protein
MISLMDFPSLAIQARREDESGGGRWLTGEKDGVDEHGHLI